MDETLFARATTKCVAEEDWECDFDDMEDSFNLIDDESANEALWAGLSAKAKPRFVKRGPAYLDPLRREAVLAAARERYRRHKEQSGQCRPLCIGGGSGRLPTYAGSAAHFHIHPGLMGVNRLIWLTCMATRGAVSAPFLASLAGVYRANASAQLAGLQGRRAGEKPLGTVAAPFCRNAAQAVGNHRRRAQMAVARRWGTSRVLFLADPRYPLRNDVNHCPIRALKRHAQLAFLRPVALALAYELRGMGRATRRTSPASPG